MYQLAMTGPSIIVYGLVSIGCLIAGGVMFVKNIGRRCRGN